MHGRHFYLLVPTVLYMLLLITTIKMLALSRSVQAFTYFSLLISGASWAGTFALEATLDLQQSHLDGCFLIIGHGRQC